MQTVDEISSKDWADKEICWSPNWNEPQTDSGTPRFRNRFGESPFRYGDPHSDMGSPFWMLFQFGDETLKSQIGTNPKLILVSDWTIPKQILGSPFWYGDVLIPISFRGSPNRFGDSLWFASPFRFGNPRFGLVSPNRYGDPQTKIGCPRIDSKTMMATGRRATTMMATATVDGATGYDDDNDGDWQWRERWWRQCDRRQRRWWLRSKAREKT